MAHITGHDRSQTLLLPESPDESCRGGICRRRAEGNRPPRLCAGGSPEAYIYGYLNRVRSSRRLEAETHRNIEVIWLLRHLKPDFKTIADSRSHNCHASRHVFRQFDEFPHGLLACRPCGNAEQTGRHTR
jgi:Transposase domain (DUF772)